MFVLSKRCPCDKALIIVLIHNLGDKGFRTSEGKCLSVKMHENSDPIRLHYSITSTLGPHIAPYTVCGTIYPSEMSYDR